MFVGAYFYHAFSSKPMMLDTETLANEIVDSTARSLRWIMSGAAGGLATHMILNDFTDAYIMGVVAIALSVSLLSDIFAKVIEGEYGSRSTQ